MHSQRQYRSNLFSCSYALGVALAALFASAVLSAAIAQNPTARPAGPDSVTVVAGEIYKAGSLHRAILGANYRDAWTTAIKVPVLDLGSLHGGLTPTKEGGGMQAKNLRLVAPDSSEYVFRQVRKTNLILSDQYRHTVIWYVVRDEGSASHPTANMPVPALLNPVGVMHPTPQLYFMPDDPRLGEFRKDFAGILGTVEEFPSVPKKGKAFANADKIVDSDELLDDLNKDASNRVDARALLTARLMDLLLGDNDRHPDQWKWARFGKGDPTIWEPIPRDRDKVFVSYGGLLMGIARFALPALVKFDSKYSDPSALFANAGEFDRRTLATLDKSVWDSVATSLVARITDPVIDNAIRAMPREYATSTPAIAAKLKARRNGLRAAADRYYQELWRFADIHGTDADDQLTVTRSGEGIVDVTIQPGSGAPYFSRRFYANETKEIRIYLHGGDDRASVQGNVSRSIPVRIIGGNGSNSLVDLSTVS